VRESFESYYDVPYFQNALHNSVFCFNGTFLNWLDIGQDFLDIQFRVAYTFPRKTKFLSKNTLVNSRGGRKEPEIIPFEPDPDNAGVGRQGKV
jgi:hypothetical protein